MKYRPEFPDCFGCIQYSRAFWQAHKVLRAGPFAVVVGLVLAVLRGR